MFDITPDEQAVIGTPCTGCGQILTLDTLSAVTSRGIRVGPVGVCLTCVPRGQVLPGMVNA